jgi:hypothetical protein
VVSQIKNDIFEPSETIELKEKRYVDQFKKNDKIYWGLGIENETYIEFNKKKFYSGKYILNNIKRERYSFDYTKNYNDFSQIKDKLLAKIFKEDKFYPITQMLNSHCFDKMDVGYNHRTTYTKNPKPNKYFNGTSILENWYDFNNEMLYILGGRDKTDSNIFFDGDTIEFITENFYKANASNVINELIERRNDFLTKLKIFMKNHALWSDFGDISFPYTHPGLNQFQTQPKNIVLFNNTTYHIHITLPTELNANAQILNNEKFINDHKKAITLIQWFEPYYITTLGSPDIFAIINDVLSNSNDDIIEHNASNASNAITLTSGREISHLTQNKALHTFGFTKGSMRAALSRYIGVGTYNPEKMNRGKILTKSISEIRPIIDKKISNSEKIKKLQIIYGKYGEYDTNEFNNFINTIKSKSIKKKIEHKFNKSKRKNNIKNNMGMNVSQNANLNSNLNANLNSITNTTSNADKCNYWWFDQIKKKMDYDLPKDKMGLDINFNKHYQSGIEFRLLDGFPVKYLKSVIQSLLLICEHSLHLSNDEIHVASKSGTWNNIVYRSLHDGYKTIISQEEKIDFILNINISVPLNILQYTSTLNDFYFAIMNELYNLYVIKNKIENSLVLKYFYDDNELIEIGPPKWDNFNKIQWEEHIKSLISNN